jgi:dihydrofolate reductase
MQNSSMEDIRGVKMGKVGTGFSMSLDGFIAGPGDDVQHVFQWYYSGDTEFKFPGGDGMVVKISAASAEMLRTVVQSAGALVTGRRQFDNTNGWGGSHPINVPVFVVTHRGAPQDWIRAHPQAPFTFVSDGVESAIAQAQKVAGAKNVIVDGANVVQQAIRAGLVDEIGIELVPVLLGGGVRYFDNLGSKPIQLEQTQAVQGIGVTHLRYRVVK